MKKYLIHLKNDDSGSILVYLLFIIHLLFICIISLIVAHHSERTFAQLEIEHLHLDTLQRMTYSQTIEYIDDLSLNVSHTINYPNGLGTYQLIKVDDQFYLNIRAERHSGHSLTVNYHTKKDEP